MLMGIGHLVGGKPPEEQHVRQTGRTLVCLKGPCPAYGTRIGGAFCFGLVHLVTDCLTIITTGQFAVPTYTSLPHISIYGRSNIMKVFVQAKNESIVINDEIIVTVLDVTDDNVILAVDAPAWIEVCEKETFEGAESMLVRPR